MRVCVCVRMRAHGHHIYTMYSMYIEDVYEQQQGNARTELTVATTHIALQRARCSIARPQRETFAALDYVVAQIQYNNRCL